MDNSSSAWAGFCASPVRLFVQVPMPVAQSGASARPSDSAGNPDLARLADQPVQRGERADEDAGPLVHAEDAVQPAERAFQPGRAGGEHHRQRHQPDRQQAAQIKRLLVHRPGQGTGGGVEGENPQPPGEDDEADEGRQGGNLGSRSGKKGGAPVLCGAPRRRAYRVTGPAAAVARSAAVPSMTSPV